MNRAEEKLVGMDSLNPKSYEVRREVKNVHNQKHKKEDSDLSESYNKRKKTKEILFLMFRRVFTCP